MGTVAHFWKRMFPMWEDHVMGNNRSFYHPGMGLTLVELLIALAIFSVLSAMVYETMRMALETRERMEMHGARLGALQMTIAVMERDVSQMAPRSIRDEYGELLPALTSSGDLSGESSHLISFTCAGWQNHTHTPRGHLRRVAYGLDEGKLLRLNWNVLDRAEDARPSSSVLLTEVEKAAIRYLDADNRWFTEWPPQGQELAPSSLDASQSWVLPRGVEITFDVAGVGRVRRLLVVSDEMPVQ